MANVNVLEEMRKVFPDARPHPFSPKGDDWACVNVGARLVCVNWSLADRWDGSVDSDWASGNDVKSLQEWLKEKGKELQS